jgi:hypothetical protein
MKLKLSDITRDDEIYPRVQRDQDYRGIAEAYFNKKLQPDEVVHHIDGEPTNNAPENLVIMKKIQHLRLHFSLVNPLKGWQRRVKRRPCNTCLYVRFYEDYLDFFPTRRKFRQFMYPFAERILRSFNQEWFLADQTKEFMQVTGAEDWSEKFYLDCKRWKEENYHDCYKQQNMSVVKEESNAF